MDTRWLAHIDSHIAAGQVAAEAESAELLSWLLKLEPEQRWCLTLNRDRRLERLSAADYRRLLSLMVEHEAQALTDAPQPPRPCLDEPLALPVPVPQDAPVARTRPTRHLGRVIAWLALAGIATLALFWLTRQDGAQRLAEFGRQVASLPQSLANEQRRLADIDERVTRETQATERLQRLLTARGALETLERKLETGEPYASELATLERIWPAPEQLAPLTALAATGSATPEILCERLERLQHGLTARRDALFQEARAGRVGRDQYYARLQSLSTLHTQGEAALAAARRDDWKDALQALSTSTESDYRDWLDQAVVWLEARTRASDLSRQIWSQWLEAQPPTAGVDSP
jgi:hypothetical protein